MFLIIISLVSFPFSKLFGDENHYYAYIVKIIVNIDSI